MKNKKRGFTIIELILALTITVVILCIMFNIFSLSTKIFSSVDIKSTLQTEAQNASEKIGSIGMKAVKIKSITLVSGEIKDFGDADKEKKYNDLGNLLKDINGQKYLEISEVTISTKEDVTGTVNYTIRYKSTADPDHKTTPIGTLSIQKDDGLEQVIGGDVEDVESVTIKPGNSSVQLSKADSIVFNVNFAKKIGFSDISYSIPINVTFRNKTIS